MADNRLKRRPMWVVGIVGAAFLTAGVTIGAMQGVFSFVKAMPQGDAIAIQWQTANEAGIQSFEIERRSEDATDFRSLGRVDARGAGNTYTYVDDGAFFKTTDTKRFTYRVKAVGGSLEQYSPTISMTHNISSVRKSWGMIKELFR